jgi:hypothetical protein
MRPICFGPELALAVLPPPPEATSPAVGDHRGPSETRDERREVRGDDEITPDEAR